MADNTNISFKKTEKDIFKYMKRRKRTEGFCISEYVKKHLREDMEKEEGLEGYKEQVKKFRIKIETWSKFLDSKKLYEECLKFEEEKLKGGKDEG